MTVTFASANRLLIHAFVLFVIVSLTGNIIHASRKDSATDSSLLIAGSQYVEFSPEGEEFSVRFPQQPQITVGKRFFGDRQANHKFHFYAVFTGSELLIVESYEGDKPGDLARIVMPFRRGARSTSSLELNGFKGREFTQEVEGLSFKARYFVTKKHLYIVDAGKRGDYNAGIDDFLNSFSLAPTGPRTRAAPAASPADETGEIIDNRSAPTKAVILFKLPATYTEAARAAMINGTVVLRAVLRSSGLVTDIQVQSGLAGGLTEQSIEATKPLFSCRR
jgi:hypothetical protein